VNAVTQARIDSVVDSFYDLTAHNAAAARRAAFILDRPVCEGQAALTVRDMLTTEAGVLRLMHARLGAAISDLRSLATYLTGSTRQHADGLVSNLDETGFAQLAQDTEREARDDAEFASVQDRHERARDERA
jgi:hypothetical protein